MTGRRVEAGSAVRDSLERAVGRGALAQVAIGAVVAAVATSRAAAHTLSPPALVGLVAGWAMTLSVLAWPQGVYAGAAEILAGELAVAEPAGPPRRTLGPAWRTAVELGAAATAWAVLGGGMVAAVLNGRGAPWIVVAVTLAGLAGTASVVVDLAGRRYGMAAATAARAAPDRIGVDAPGDLRPTGRTPLRRRAWREVALPLAVLQAAVNGAGAWILFHSYARPGTVGSAVGPVLTSRVALADAAVLIVIVGFLNSATATSWGAVDGALGRVDVPPDVASLGVSPTSPLGAQALVYVGVLALVLAKVAQTLLPKSPTLVEVAAARALLAFVMAIGAAGFGYARGALNAQRLEPVRTTVEVGA